MHIVVDFLCLWSVVSTSRMTRFWADLTVKLSQFADQTDGSHRIKTTLLEVFRLEPNSYARLYPAEDAHPHTFNTSLA